MYSLAVLAFVSSFLALLLTPFWRNLFRRWGVVDIPDNGRKMHVVAVPRVGGVPLMTAYLGAFAVLLITPLNATRVVEAGLPLAWKVLPAAALVFAIGLVDDIRGLKPWQKLGGELLAACIAVGGGVQMTGIVGLIIPHWLSVPLTIVWLVGCANAFNLIDGIDGLAAGAGLFATVTMLLGALLTNNVALALATMPLAGALLGFLRYNFNPASIFLGDSGSLTMGFLLGCYGVLWSEKAATVLGITAPLMALAVPLIDTAVAIARRFLRQQPIMSADAAHIHHRLLARGLTPRKAALILYGACGLTAGLSLLGSVAEDQYKGFIIVVFCTAAWIGVRHLGYVEFDVAGRMFVDGAFRSHIRNQISLRTFEQALAVAATPEDYWSAIQETCRKFGFTHVELWLSGQRFEQTLVETNGNAVWNVDIPLAAGGRLRLARCFGEPQALTVLASFADAVHRSLRAGREKHSTAALEALAVSTASPAPPAVRV